MHFDISTIDVATLQHSQSTIQEKVEESRSTCAALEQKENGFLKVLDLRLQQKQIVGV